MLKKWLIKRWDDGSDLGGRAVIRLEVSGSIPAVDMFFLSLGNQMKLNLLPMAFPSRNVASDKHKQTLSNYTNPMAMIHVS